MRYFDCHSHFSTKAGLHHKTMEEYFLAKCRLFEQLPPTGFAVINQDDPVGVRLAQATKAKVIMYGLSPAADLRARNGEISLRILPRGLLPPSQPWSRHPAA